MNIALLTGKSVVRKSYFRLDFRLSNFAPSSPLLFSCLSTISLFPLFQTLPDHPDLKKVHELRNRGAAAAAAAAQPTDVTATGPLLIIFPALILDNLTAVPRVFRATNTDRPCGTWTTKEGSER